MEKNKEHGGHSATTSPNAVDDLRKNWQGWIKNHIDYQKSNPFSHDAPAIVVNKGDPTYGRPPKGSKTEQRGKDAHVHVEKELEELCWILRNNGEKGADGNSRMTFKQLFERYATISNKVVGLLLRARKHGMVHFEGEMLWQGQDDDVIITLLR
uniref:Actin-binding Rho-activating protein n=1 Tax=Sarcophilus harrisii TaxID=9305 RepID=A0A7N4NNE5_SARHA